ncbi:MAG TPA: hypothetical protein EYQ66_09415 [Myxococcales bacterium]|nr:hypothetical protein [Myxococcales bacterium]HIL02533.1 hypothetical protein [Myxococcales bacterium]
MAAKKKVAAEAAKKKAAAEAAKKKAAALAAKEKAEAERLARAAVAEKKKRDQARAAADKKLRRARAKVPPPAGPMHPTRGYKYTCFACGLKFYDMNRPEPTCPTCEEDQRDRPLNVTPPAPTPRKAAAVRPMAPLLDEDEIAPADDNAAAGDEAQGVAQDPATAIFDDPGQASETDES